MREPHHLNNAPIREALVDIFVEFPGDMEPSSQVKVLESLVAKVKEEYPNVQNVAEGQLQVDFKEKQGRFEQNVLGFRCFNGDNNRAVQFRRDGFTFNWLRPYTEWADFRSQAARMWQLYREAATPAKVVRLGLRFINDLALPLPFDSFGEYLVADPIVPKELPQGLSRFLTRVTLDNEEGTASATLTQAFEGVTDPDRVNVILDIDTRIQAEFAPEDSAIWERLDGLRDFKNKIFFASLTDKAVRLFE